MNVIYKYPLICRPTQVLTVPQMHNLLHLGLDGDDNPALWMGVDPSSVKINLEVIMVGTGWPVPHVGDYLGTVTVRTGYVWHFFTGPNSSINRYTSCHYQTRANHG